MRTKRLTALVLAKFIRIFTDVDSLRVSTPAPFLPKFLPTISKKHLLSKVDEAYDWLCKSRISRSFHNEIWTYRHNWLSEKATIINDLENGRYVFKPLLSVRASSVIDCSRNTPQNSHVSLPQWSARDLVVLKALALLLAKHLPSSTHCTHLKGNGGLKGAIRQVVENKNDYKFFCRTDVKSYYASINHEVLLQRLELFIKDRTIMNLLGQYLNRTIEYGGTFKEIRQGISAGCPLSPLIGAFYLYEMDVALKQRHPNCFYVRYMDDILIMAKSRWQLRRAIATMNGCLENLSLQQHPDKTSMGHIAKGFDFLGYHHTPSSLRLAKTTVLKHQAKMIRLYEQCKRKQAKQRLHFAGLNSHSVSQKRYAHHQNTHNRNADKNWMKEVDTYQKRFWSWANGGLSQCSMSLDY